MVDVHCHLTSGRFERDRAKVIEQADRQLEAVIISTTHPDDAKKALKLCQEYPSLLHVTLGLHPVYAPEIGDREIEDYLKFIKSHRAEIVGIGEVGLDYHWIKDAAKIKRMRAVFIEFLKLARELDLPVVLHLREAIGEGLDIVRSYGMKKVVFHCFNGTEKQAEEISRHNYYMSIATNILKSRNIGQSAKIPPLSQLLTETDSPYLGPMGRRNVPQNVSLVIDKLAELRDLPSDELNEITSRNARKAFGLPE